MCTLSVRSRAFGERVIGVQLQHSSDQGCRRPLQQRRIVDWLESEGVGVAGRTVIDFFCGAGELPDILIERGAARYVGVEINAHIAQHAAMRSGRDPRVRILCADACRPLHLGRAGLAFVGYEALNAVRGARLTTLLANARRALDDDGYLVGDVRVLSRPAPRDDYRVEVYRDPPFFPVPGLCVDESGSIHDGRYFGHRYLLEAQDGARRRRYRGHSFVRLVSEEELSTLLARAGFGIVRAARVLCGYATDVQESRDNLHFIARPRRRATS